MLRFNKTYFILAIMLFITEVFIALFVHNNFIRPYFGDILVVILIYCFIKSFIKVKILTASIFVLLFACGIETLQYFRVVEKLKLENVDIARTAIGTSFEWMDILCYVVGILIVITLEKMRMQHQ